jgi:hypothetical protein
MESSAPDPPATGPQPPASPPRRSNWTAGRIVGMVFTSIGGLIGLALLLGGIALLAAYAFARDDDGYFKTDRTQLGSPAYAIATGHIDLGDASTDWAPGDVLGKVRIRAEGDHPVFVGIGSDDDVDRYLDGVGYDELTNFGHGDPKYEAHRGGAPGTPPGKQDFWVAQAEGPGEQTLNWDVEFGDWTAVLMNADAARGVDVEADAGVKLDWAIWVGVGLLVVGLLMSAGAVALILLISRRASRDPAPA